jgi:hypothetical protein
MKYKIIAILTLILILVMETMTVFATEGGSESPTSKTVKIDILEGTKRKSNPNVDVKEIRLARDFGMASKFDLAEKFGLEDDFLQMME